MNFDNFLDIIIVVLLLTTIIWCVILNRRLRGLRANQGELATLIAELNLATSRAESGITVLKANADEAGASLQTSIEQAERLNDDLAYLSERGTRLVEQLDGPTKRARQSAFAAKGAASAGLGEQFEPREPREPREAPRREAPAEAPAPGVHGGIADLLAEDEVPDFVVRSEDVPDFVARGGEAEEQTDAPSRRSFGNGLLNALKTAR